MALDDSIVLKEAAGEMRPGNLFEEILGKVTRRHGGSYDDYIRLMSSVRNRAEQKGMSLVQAARDVAKNP